MGPDRTQRQQQHQRHGGGHHQRDVRSTHCREMRQPRFEQVLLRHGRQSAGVARGEADDEPGRIAARTARSGSNPGTEPFGGGAQHPGGIPPAHARRGEHEPDVQVGQVLLKGAFAVDASRGGWPLPPRPQDRQVVGAAQQHALPRGRLAESFESCDRPPAMLGGARFGDHDHADALGSPSVGPGHGRSLRRERGANLAAEPERQRQRQRARDQASAAAPGRYGRRRHECADGGPRGENNRRCRPRAARTSEGTGQSRQRPGTDRPDHGSPDGHTTINGARFWKVFSPMPGTRRRSPADANGPFASR